MGGSHNHVAVRPSPPFHDWILSHDPPEPFDDLVWESQLHRRCSLFGLSLYAGVETENGAVPLEIAPRNSSPPSHASSSSTFVDGSPLSLVPVTPRSIAPWPQPKHSPKNQTPVLRANHLPISRRGDLTNLPLLLNPRDFRSIPRGQPPRLAIEGPTHRARVPPRPVVPIPAPPLPSPPRVNVDRPPRGIHFLFTDPAHRMRMNPETSIPRAIVEIPPRNTPNPELNPED